MTENKFVENRFKIVVSFGSDLGEWDWHKDVGNCLACIMLNGGLMGITFTIGFITFIYHMHSMDLMG